MTRMVLTVLVSGLFLASGLQAEAATKKGRSAYTKAQQAAFFKEATQLCRKRFGSSLHYVKVDYRKGRPQFWCYHY